MKKCFIGLFAALLLESGGGSGSGGGGGTTYDIVTFGSFPQSEKDSTVSITSESKIVGSFTYYKGDDNEWYAELNSKYSGSQFSHYSIFNKNALHVLIYNLFLKDTTFQVNETYKQGNLVILVQ